VELIATSAIMSFIFSWNQFLFSLILSGSKTKTVLVSVFAFFVRKSIVQGLTMGALKD
jgi:multiple sugar transport system permease protein